MLVYRDIFDHKILWCRSCVESGNLPAYELVRVQNSITCEGCSSIIRDIKRLKERAAEARKELKR